MARQEDRQGWYRLTVRLPENEYRAFEATCRKLDESPNALIRALIMKILPDLEIIGDVLPTAAGEERVTAMELLQTLATVYERRAERLRTAARAREVQD